MTAGDSSYEGLRTKRSRLLFKQDVGDAFVNDPSPDGRFLAEEESVPPSKRLRLHSKQGVCDDYVDDASFVDNSNAFIGVASTVGVSPEEEGVPRPERLRSVAPMGAHDPDLAALRPKRRRLTFKQRQ